MRPLSDILNTLNPFLAPMLIERPRDPDLYAPIRQDLQRRIPFGIPLHPRTLCFRLGAQGLSVRCSVRRRRHARMRQQLEEMFMLHTYGQDTCLSGVLEPVARTVHHPAPAGFDPGHPRMGEVGRRTQSLGLRCRYGNFCGVCLVYCDGVGIVKGPDLPVGCLVVHDGSKADVILVRIRNF